MDIQDVVVAGISALIGTGGGATVALPVLKSVVRAAVETFAAKQRAMEAELKTLREEKVIGLERRMGKIEDGCQHHADNVAITQLQTTMDNMKTVTVRFEQTSKELGEGVAGMTEAIKGLEGFIRDVRKEAHEAREAVITHERELHMRRPA